MKVLVITPTPTHPATQGNRVRVAQIASALKAQGAIVELLYYAIDGTDTGSLADMRAAWDAVYLVGAGSFRPRRRYPAYWGVDDWISPALLQSVRFLAETTHYDAVVVNYVWCSLLLEAFCEPGPHGRRTLRILDTHDAFAGRHEVARKAGMRPHWFYTTAAEEARGLDRADIVLAIQAEEAKHFAAITRARVETVEYAAPPRFLPVSARRSLTVGYLGSGNPWNVRSVEEFDAALAAAFAGPDSDPAQAGRAQFRLFGGVTRAVGKLAMFLPLGVMDDVRDAYAEMDLVVNPMVSGTGLKIKTVEALGFGRPVLSTRAGGAGLEEIHPDLLHADCASLIGRLGELIAQPGEVAALSLAMQAGYRTFYEGVETRLRGLLESMM